MRLVSSFALWSLATWVALRWAHLPGALRAGLRRGCLASALVCLAAASCLRGGYSEQVMLFIGGPYPYPVETVERSFASLAVGIGIALLALYALARWGERLPARGPLAKAFAFTLALLALRVYLEKLGVPVAFAALVGIIWLIVPLAVYLGVEAARAGSRRRFWAWFLGYTFGVRFFIVVVMIIATHSHLGTHFDNSSITRYMLLGRAYTVEPGSWEQYRNLILLPQLVLWTSVTLLAGLVVGWPACLVASRRYASRIASASTVM